MQGATDAGADRYLFYAGTSRNRVVDTRLTLFVYADSQRRHSLFPLISFRFCGPADYPPATNTFGEGEITQPGEPAKGEFVVSINLYYVYCYNCETDIFKNFLITTSYYH